jgi:hypothetical protein
MQLVALEEAVFSMVLEQGLSIVYDHHSQVDLASCFESFKEEVRDFHDLLR